MNRRTLLSRLPLFAALPWVAKRAGAEAPTATVRPRAPRLSHHDPPEMQNVWVDERVDGRWVERKEVAWVNPARGIAKLGWPRRVVRGRFVERQRARAERRAAREIGRGRGNGYGTGVR
jgi:hypothetical protein